LPSSFAFRDFFGFDLAVCVVCFISLFGYWFEADEGSDCFRGVLRWPLLSCLLGECA